MNEEHQEILRNARRLRDDAKLLCDAGRYASCALLQIFCFEELGKYHLVGKGISNTPRDWHLIKQQTALSLAGGTAFQRRVEEKCLAMGWDYLGNGADAEAFYKWLLEDGKKEMTVTLGKVSSWFRVTQAGFMEKIRRLAAYVDVGDKAIGKNLEAGRTYSYKSVDLPFVTNAFRFIDDAFECLGNESATGMADLLRTEIWNK